MSYQYQKDLVTTMAAAIKAVGFRVFIAERGTYGFYTDADGTRVVSFGCDLGVFNFSGNYVTNQPQQCGTGWRLLTQPFDHMFAQTPPQWAVRNATWRYKTLKEHLDAYQSSSKFEECT